MPRKRYLCLDSDIVFVGKVLEKIQATAGDFVFNPHYLTPPVPQETLYLYIDPKTLEDSYPNYEYPGYFFNAGQTVVTPGILKERLIADTFQTKKYPYFLKRFRCADQPILNMVMPVLKKEQNLEIGSVTFMTLSPQFFADNTNNNFQKFRGGETELMVHYAGDVRSFDLDKMKGNELLKAIKNEYYLKLSPFQRMLETVQDKVHSDQPD